VSGVVGGVMYADDGFVGSGYAGLGGDEYRGPEDGDGLGPVVEDDANGFAVGGGVAFVVDGRM